MYMYYSIYNNNGNIGSLFIFYKIEILKIVLNMNIVAVTESGSFRNKKNTTSSFKITLHIIQLLEIKLYLKC